MGAGNVRWIDCRTGAAETYGYRRFGISQVSSAVADETLGHLGSMESDAFLDGEQLLLAPSYWTTIEYFTSRAGS
jgi:hypothetical protein